jgi:AraC family transcriptional regulator of adaptative response/methylated-DNA-[protein]-cysteine methyltransferase
MAQGTLSANLTGERQREAVLAACRLIDESEEAPRLDQLAAAAGLSKYHFHRLFRQTTGVTPAAYAAQVRWRRARERLRDAESVTDAIYEAGFASSGRFYSGTAASLGMTPGAYRAHGRGEVVRCGVAPCSLGYVAVGATERGVCAIMLGDDPQSVIEDVRHKFRHARLVDGDAAFDSTLNEVLQLIDEPARACDLPLDVRGTAFQQRVWAALRAIPAGTTATYSEIAERIGHPTAVRAVANACGANPVPVAIPCHRVVEKGGGLGGYSAGIERKVKLLQREGSRST